jgi:hypothetical protein
LKDEKSWFFQHPTRVPSALAWKGYIISKTTREKLLPHTYQQIDPIKISSYMFCKYASQPFVQQGGSVQNLLLHEIISGNRTSLLVIIDLHLIVLVLLIIEYRARSVNVGSCATHSNRLCYLEESQLASAKRFAEEGRGIEGIR